MDHKVCFSTSVVTIFVIAFLILGVYAVATKVRYEEQGRRIEGIHNQLPQPLPPQRPAPMLPPTPLPPPPPVDPISEYDRRKVVDIFTQPTSRQPRSALVPYNLLSYNSRGATDTFSSIGFLSRVDPGGKDDERRLPLFGRQEYPGGKWEYYTSTTNLGVNIKIPFYTRQNQLQSDDIVNLKDFDGKNYKIILYKIDSPSYNPFSVMLPPTYPGF